VSDTYAMPKVGDVIAGKYRLEKVAGEGGMGIVYAAEHLVLKQRVAVKVLLPDAATSDAVVERFSREAQAGARIQSEHIARVMDAGSLASGAPFLVMEYLEGCDLEELVELQGTLPVAEVCDYMLQALEALAHAHAVGLVHRDLKPANLFLACRPDGSNVIKMVDFGISKSVKARPEEKRLTGHHVLGSPVYMSPEQLRNAKEIDGRADLWSLGVVAYEMLSGVTPFDGDGVGEIFAAILESEAKPLHERNPKVPEELSAIITKCLRRNVEERWQDAASLARALVPFGSGAWTPLVERAEQVLARAKMLNVMETPMEMRLVVDAIAAAAQRARTTGQLSVPPLPLTQKKGEDKDNKDKEKEKDPKKQTADMGFVTRITVLAPSSRWIGVAAVATVVVGVVAVAGAVRSTRSATAAPAPLAAMAVRDAESAPSEPAAPNASTSASAAAAPTSFEIIDSTPRPAGNATKKGGKHGKRPTFLKTRE
jgi:serine/threonine protein kinase